MLKMEGTSNIMARDCIKKTSHLGLY